MGRPQKTRLPRPGIRKPQTRQQLKLGKSVAYSSHFEMKGEVLSRNQKRSAAQKNRFLGESLV